MPINWDNPWSQLPVWLKKLFCVIKGYFISFLLSNIIGYLRFCWLDFFPFDFVYPTTIPCSFSFSFSYVSLCAGWSLHDGLEYLIFRESFGGSLHFLKADSYFGLPYGHVFSIAQFGFLGSAGICFFSWAFSFQEPWGIAFASAVPLCVYKISQKFVLFKRQYCIN